MHGVRQLLSPTRMGRNASNGLSSYSKYAPHASHGIAEAVPCLAPAYLQRLCAGDWVCAEQLCRVPLPKMALVRPKPQELRLEDLPHLRDRGQQPPPVLRPDRPTDRQTNRQDSLLPWRTKPGQMDLSDRQSEVRRDSRPVFKSPVEVGDKKMLHVSLSRESHLPLCVPSLLRHSCMRRTGRLPANPPSNPPSGRRRAYLLHFNMSSGVCQYLCQPTFRGSTSAAHTTAEMRTLFLAAKHGPRCHLLHAKQDQLHRIGVE
jgi:hypothetical protein